MDIHRRPSATAVRSLLTAAKLPATDLPDELEHFLACGPRAGPTGVVGLELYGHDALLRSLVVSPAMRGRGCGKALVDAAEAYARDAAVQRMFLLTETAEPFFASLGYFVASRDSAPDAIRGSTEFSSLCPASAAFMWKAL
jgi:amino-acid N-acetyltransferase